jgi:hypothetical protein
MSSSRPARRAPSPEKISLDNFANGDDGRSLGVDEKRAISLEDFKEIADTFKGMLKLGEDMANRNRGDDKKSKIPGWLSNSFYVAILACIIISFIILIIASFNFNSYFPEEFQKAAFDKLSMLPVALAAYFLGKKVTNE